MEPTETVPGDHRPEDFVQSVGRAVRLLEVVGREPGLPVKAIARRCELNISTTYHLARTLAYEGYLVRLSDGTYVIGGEVARRFHDLLTTLAGPPRVEAVLSEHADRAPIGPSSGLGREDRVTVIELSQVAGAPPLEDVEAVLDAAAQPTVPGARLVVAMTPRRHPDDPVRAVVVAVADEGVPTGPSSRADPPDPPTT